MSTGAPVIVFRTAILDIIITVEIFQFLDRLRDEYVKTSVRTQFQFVNKRILNYSQLLVIFEKNVESNYSFKHLSTKIFVKLHFESPCLATSKRNLKKFGAGEALFFGSGVYSIKIMFFPNMSHEMT